MFKSLHHAKLNAVARDSCVSPEKNREEWSSEIELGVNCIKYTMKENHTDVVLKRFYK